MTKTKKIALGCTLAFTCLGFAIASDIRNKAEMAPLHAANDAFNQFKTACNAIAETRKYYRDDVPSVVWNQIISQKIDIETAFWEKLLTSQHPFTGAAEVHIEEISRSERGHYLFVYSPKSTTSDIEKIVIRKMLTSVKFVEKSDDPERLSCDKLARHEPIRIGQWRWEMTDLSPAWLYRERNPRAYKLTRAESS